MKATIRGFLRLMITTSAIVATTACGGGGNGVTSGSTSSGSGSGGSGTPVNNTVQMSVDLGPATFVAAGNANEDVPFVSVTICVPGTTNCATVDHVEVDTGSEGLRLLNTAFNLSLPQQTINGNPVGECVQFADSTFSWGSVQTADIQVAGETAKAVPIQVINGSFQTIPTSCSNGGSGVNDIFSLGANGILGVGPFRQDCGGGCVNSAVPGTYYACNNGACTSTAESLTAQLQNPVWMFPSDNNGVILQFPSVSDSGQAAPVLGSLIFGIGTQSNNGLGSATLLPIDSGKGNFSVQFQGMTFNDNSFIDSGSNGFFFLDSATLANQFGVSIPDCPKSSVANGFYCPGAITPISVSMLGVTSSGSTPLGAARAVTFNIANAQTLFSSPNLAAFDNVGGENSGSFDFGLPFFFGKSVYTAIEGQSTPAGTGPYFAF